MGLAQQFASVVPAEVLFRHGGNRELSGKAALHQARQRGVIMAAGGEIDPKALPDFVFPIESVPHDWLFPRMGDHATALEEAQDPLADFLHELLDLFLAGRRRRVEHPALAVNIRAVHTVEKQRVEVR